MRKIDPQVLDGDPGVVEILEDGLAVGLLPVLEEAAELDLGKGLQGDVEEREDERGQEAQGEPESRRASSALTRPPRRRGVRSGPFLGARPGAVVDSRPGGGSRGGPGSRARGPRACPRALAWRAADRDGDDDVAEVEVPVRPRRADGEAQDVGRLVLLPEGPVERPDGPGPDEDEGDLRRRRGRSGPPAAQSGFRILFRLSGCLRCRLMISIIVLPGGRSPVFPFSSSKSKPGYSTRGW